MGSSQGSGSAAAFLLLAVASILVASALGKTIPVAWNQQTDYGTWAAGQTFNEGDELVFNFDSSHTCVQVNQAGYQSCSGANMVKSYSSGDTIKLSKGDNYFICTVPGHCQPGGSGMALKATVSPSATPTTPSTPTTPGSGTPTTPGTTPTTPTTPETPTTPTTGSPKSGSAGLTVGTLLAASAAIAPLLL